MTLLKYFGKTCGAHCHTGVGSKAKLLQDALLALSLLEHFFTDFFMNVYCKDKYRRGSINDELGPSPKNSSHENVNESDSDDELIDDGMGAHTSGCR